MRHPRCVDIVAMAVVWLDSSCSVAELAFAFVAVSVSVTVTVAAFAFERAAVAFAMVVAFAWPWLLLGWEFAYCYYGCCYFECESSRPSRSLH